MASNDNGGSFVIGFLFGGVVGAVVGILLAPKAGSETRADIRVQSDVLRARAEELAAMAREQVGPTVEAVRDRVGPAVEGVREQVSPIAERVASAVGRGAARPEADGETVTEEPSAPRAASASDDPAEDEKPGGKKGV